MPYISDFPVFYVTVDIVLLALRDQRLNVLVVDRGEPPFAGQPALPGGFVGPEEELEAAARRELAEETGINPTGIALEQLRTFGSPRRDPRPHRVVSVAYLGVTPHTEQPHAGSDAAEARWEPVDTVSGTLAFDHDEILNTARNRVAAKLEYTGLAASFLEPQFTLAQLRAVYEAVWGTALDPGNFQRKLRNSPDFVTALDQVAPPPGGRGRPAQLFRATAQPFAPLRTTITRGSL